MSSSSPPSPAAAATASPRPGSSASQSAASFSVRVSSHRDNVMLNICDPELVGTTASDGERNIAISRGYYCERTVDRREAEKLLQTSSIINMAGEKTISMSIGMGIGIESGIKHVGDVPFLIVIKM